MSNISCVSCLYERHKESTRRFVYFILTNWHHDTLFVIISLHAISHIYRDLIMTTCSKRLVPFMRLSIHPPSRCIVITYTKISISEPYCRLTFDGWSCWPNTQAGSIAYAPCPNFITGFDTSRKYTLISTCDFKFIVVIFPILVGVK